MPSIEAYQVLDMEDGDVIKPATTADRLNQIVAVLRERFDLHEIECQIAGDDQTRCVRSFQIVRHICRAAKM